jgi:hypothetical protein
LGIVIEIVVAREGHIRSAEGPKPTFQFQISAIFFQPDWADTGRFVERRSRCRLNQTAPRALPNRPNLCHLKHQAKDLSRAGRAASIADAQFQIARLYALASWPKLKAHVDSRFAFPDRSPPAGAPCIVGYNAVSPTYFSTVRMPLLEGRLFTPADGPDIPRVTPSPQLSSAEALPIKASDNLLGIELTAVISLLNATDAYW